MASATPKFCNVVPETKWRKQFSDAERKLIGEYAISVGYRLRRDNRFQTRAFCDEHNLDFESVTSLIRDKLKMARRAPLKPPAVPASNEPVTGIAKVQLDLSVAQTILAVAVKKEAETAAAHRLAQLQLQKAQITVKYLQLIFEEELKTAKMRHVLNCTHAGPACCCDELMREVHE